MSKDVTMSGENTDPTINAANYYDKLMSLNQDALRRCRDILYDPLKAPVIIEIPPDTDQWRMIGSHITSCPIDAEIYTNLGDPSGYSIRGAPGLLPYHGALKWNGEVLQIKPAKSARIIIGKPFNPNFSTESRIIQDRVGSGEHEDRIHINLAQEHTIIVQCGNTPFRLFMPKGSNNLRIVFPLDKTQSL